MSHNDFLSPLQAALTALVEWLNTERIAYALIGGLAASMLGRPRMTRDIDVLARLEEDRWAPFVASGERWGYQPRIPDCVEFARQSRVLLLRHEPTPIDADIVCAGLAYEHAVIDASELRNIGETAVRVLRPEDMIVMKAVAQRPRDIGDIEGIVDTQHSLDWDYIIDRAREFAKVLDASDILRTVESFRNRHK